MSSTIKKERVIYFTGIALFAVFMIALCLPYIGVGLYTDKQSVTQADYVVYLGWQLFAWTGYYKGAPKNNPNSMPSFTESGEPLSTVEKTLRTITPTGTESIFVIFNYVLLGIVVFLAVIDGIALYRSYKTGLSMGKKFINLFHIGYAVVSAMILISYIPYVNYLNNHVFSSTNESSNATAAKAWATFAFKSLSGVETTMQCGPFIIAIAGLVAAAVSLIFTMKIQDNSILYPYKSRQVMSSCVCIALCVAVFFLPCIDYYFSTYSIYGNAARGMKELLFSGPNSALDERGLEKVAQSFTTGVGWDCILYGSGDIAGYFKLIFILMFVIAGMGIIYSILNLLGAASVIRFNFDRKYTNLICGVLMGCSLLLLFGSLVYSIGVNTRLESLFNTEGFTSSFLIAYPDGQFPQTVCTVGAWLSVLPGIAGFVGVKVLNAFDD